MWMDRMVARRERQTEHVQVPSHEMGQSALKDDVEPHLNWVESAYSSFYVFK